MTIRKVSKAILVWIFACGMSFADDLTDHSEITPACKDKEFLTEIFSFKGRPLNRDADREVTVIVNHGYMVGFSLERKQPVWAAYRVSKATRDTHYERPPFFYQDLRIPEESRVKPGFFGGGFDRGHMVPNFAINTQYGKLAQLETFLMSNVSPQHKNLNRGLWQRLEHDIVEKFAPAFKQVWVITGPIFEEDRGVRMGVKVPSHFYMLLVDVGGPFNRNIDILGLRFSQDTPRSASLDEEHIRSVNELEELTKLNFFPQFSDTHEQRYESDRSEEVWEVD